MGYCCKYGILKVIFNTITNPTLDGVDGYQDYSCEHQTYVDMGSSYTLSITTGPDNPQDTKVWIDINNDGVFDNSTELFLDAPNTYSPSVSITIPNSIAINTPLRMRISSDEVGNNFTSCSDMFRGQVEDYAIIVNDTTCPAPTNLSVNVTGNNAELNWSPGGNETSWNIEYGPSGFNLGFGNSLTTTTNPRTIFMPLGTCWEFYVQADCGLSLSGWAGPIEGCTVGIDENSTLDFTIFPNPSNGTININSASSSIDRILIYNLIGEVAQLHGHLNSLQEFTLELSSLSKGTYIIEISDNLGNKGFEKIILF